MTVVGVSHVPVVGLHVLDGPLRQSLVNYTEVALRALVVECSVDTVGGCGLISLIHCNILNFLLKIEHFK